jgi:hypothetical protein
LLAFGCTESVESEDVRTSGIYPEVMVTATGDGQSRVEVRMKVGGPSSNTYLDMTGDDKIEVTVGDVTRKLDETSSDTYTASFAGDAEGTQFVVSFLRGDADDDAPASTVTLPAPFDLATDATEYSRAADDVMLSWDPPASGQVAWKLSGSCIKLAGGSTPDDGSHALASGSIDTFESDRMESCTANLEVTRSRSGSIDPAFSEGGNIVARQVRAGAFTSNP